MALAQLRCQECVVYGLGFRQVEVSLIRSTFSGVPINKSYTILGSILGSSHLEKLPGLSQHDAHDPLYSKTQTLGTAPTR